MDNQGIHPLLIDLVIEKLFTSIKTQELKNCRLVCKYWSYIGYQILQPRCKETILLGDSTRSKDLEVFTKALKSIQEQIHLPYTTFTLQPSAFSLKRSQTLEDFFNCSSHLITILSLAYQDHSHYLTFNQGSSFMRIELPHLTKFRFEVLPIEQFSPGNTTTLSASELFRNIYQSAKNLIRLELIISSDNSDVTQTDSYVRTICTSSFGIRELVMNALFSETHLKSLIAAGYQFKLESIHFRFKNPNFKQNSPLDFFKTQAPYIKRLKIDPWNVYKVEEIKEFPQMPFLEVLEVLEWKPYSGSSPLPFKFTYKNSFPNLKKLTFQCHHWQEFFIEFFPSCNNYEIVKSMRELKLPKHIGIDSSMLIRRISNLFPNLVKLEIAICPESLYCLQDIFRLLINLEDLTISFVNGIWDGRCIDYILTGIPEAICKQIYSVSDVSKVDLSNIHVGASIRELKYLKKLQLRNMSKYCRKGRPQFTDISGYHTLLKLHRLVNLSLWPSQMSKDCINELEKHFNLTIHEF